MQLEQLTPARSWAFFRQMIYIGSFGLILLILGIVVYRTYFYHAPTCFDGLQNAAETGVDCGGTCARICTAAVQQPKVLWAKAFRIRPGQYNAAAYIQNPNTEYGTPQLTYTLRMFDDVGQIAERTHTIILPPDGVYPVFESNIDAGGRIPVRTELTIEPATEWYRATSTRDIFQITRRDLSGAGGFPRIDATVFNTQYTTARNLRAVATVFDAAGHPLTSSQTTIDALSARASTPIVFTWPEEIAGTIRSCIVPTDIAVLLDRSGSMASDGGNPPEPLESAKNAAINFLKTLQDKDRSAFISYATQASLDSPLTTDLSRTLTAAKNVRMSTKGVQYTDIHAALTLATNELFSEHHNPDARRVIVLLTDGDVTRPLNAKGERDIPYATEQALAAARSAKDKGATVFTIGFGKEFMDAAEGIVRNDALITGIASSPEHTFRAPTLDRLREVYSSISNSICEDGPAIIDIVIVPAS